MVYSMCKTKVRKSNVRTMEVVLTTWTEEDEFGVAEKIHDHYAFHRDDCCKECQEKLVVMLNDAMVKIETKLKK